MELCKATDEERKISDKEEELNSGTFGIVYGLGKTAIKIQNVPKEDLEKR